MIKEKLFKYFKIAIALVFVAGFIFYISICIAIFIEVKSISKQAQEHYSGDVVEALIAALNSESADYRTRNDVVYALGQIGDERSFAVLQKYYTGEPCERPCRKDKYICQYDLETALKGCKGGFSATRWMYAYFD